MLLIVFHLLLTIGLLWYQRKRGYGVRPVWLALGWFAVNLLLVYIDAAVSFRSFAPGIELLRGAIVSLFLLPPVFFALAWRAKRRAGLLGPFLVYLVFAAISLIVVGLIFARAQIVSGLTLA